MWTLLLTEKWGILKTELLKMHFFQETSFSTVLVTNEY